jgi:hypothetical protein
MKEKEKVKEIFIDCTTNHVDGVVGCGGYPLSRWSYWLKGTSWMSFIEKMIDKFVFTLNRCLLFLCM